MNVYEKYFPNGMGLIGETEHFSVKVTSFPMPERISSLVDDEWGEEMGVAELVDEHIRLQEKYAVSAIAVGLLVSALVVLSFFYFIK